MISGTASHNSTAASAQEAPKLSESDTGPHKIAPRASQESLNASQEPHEPDGLVSSDSAPATLSRRGALALVGGGATLVAVLTLGQTIGGWPRHAALLLPRVANDDVQ